MIFKSNRSELANYYLKEGKSSPTCLLNPLLPSSSRGVTICLSELNLKVLQCSGNLRDPGVYWLRLQPCLQPPWTRSGQTCGHSGASLLCSGRKQDSQSHLRWTAATPMAPALTSNRHSACVTKDPVTAIGGSRLGRRRASKKAQLLAD